MATKEFSFSPAQILSPLYPSPLNRLMPIAFGANLTVGKGQAMGRKTSDGKAYPLSVGATDGTQTFAGFNRQACATDASGNVFFVYGGTAAGGSVYSPQSSYAEIYTGGIFDPTDLVTSATGTPVAEVDTLTPSSPTTGDIFTVGTATREVSFTVGGTQTAAAVVTGLTNAWNADPVLKALATPSGSSTLILTAKTAGQAMNLQAGVSGTGTTALVITTPATDAQQSEVDTITPAGSITTGDVNTLTVTLPSTTQIAVTFTVGGTTTATAVANGLRAAWNANATLAALATASGTATLILTASQAGGSLNVTSAVTGVGTLTKVVTSPALGRDITHVLSGCPGARVLANGAWELP